MDCGFDAELATAAHDIGADTGVVGAGDDFFDVTGVFGFKLAPVVVKVELVVDGFTLFDESVIVLADVNSRCERFVESSALLFGDNDDDCF